MPRSRRLKDADYARLLAVRTSLRRFERWSAEQAAAQGLTSAQHQLLLAVRGHPGPQRPTVGEVANYLFIQHHSAVELVNRTERAGFLTRSRDGSDHRVIRLQLAPEGALRLAALTASHVDELGRLATLVEAMVGALNAAD